MKPSFHDTMAGTAGGLIRQDEADRAERKQHMEEYIGETLAPRLQADGGWVEFEGQEGDLVTLGFRGECSKCEILDRCAGWIEQKILADRGERVRVRAIRRRPYFQDNV